MKNISLKKYFLTILTVLLFVHNGYCQAHAGQNHPLRVLVVGNSFSQNATTYLPQIAREGGRELVIGRAEIGGCSLQKHWELAELDRTEPNNPKGKPYLGNKSLRMLLTEGIWDVVTFQQYSGLSGNIQSYRPYAKMLYNLIKQLQPKARILLHQTWAYRSDSRSFGEVAPGVPAKSEKEMYERSRAAYLQIAKENNISLIPTGDAFWLISSDSASAYKKDENFNPETAIYPALPDQKNSLNIGWVWVDNKLVFDTHHANDAGKYLGGLVWYKILFKKSVKKVKFVPKGISKEFAGLLKGKVENKL